MGGVQHWTGREARALRLARRMSTRQFAAHLGIARSTVLNWEKRGDAIELRGETQQILDADLGLAAEDVRSRLEVLISALPATVDTAPIDPQRPPAALTAVPATADPGHRKPHGSTSSDRVTPPTRWSDGQLGERMDQRTSLGNVTEPIAIDAPPTPRRATARPVVNVHPDFGRTLTEIRQEQQISLRGLASRIPCSHTLVRDLERGTKHPSKAIADRLDAALKAGGRLTAMVQPVLTDNGLRSPARGIAPDGAVPGLEFPPDWRHGLRAATELWQGDMYRREVLRGAGFTAAVYLTPALRWLTSPLDERPIGRGDRLVGTPEVEMVRRITGVYRTLDNQYGGGHIRDSVVRFLEGEVTHLLRGQYDIRTGKALLSAAAEAAQLAAWASYDVGMHGLAQRYMIQALRLAAAASDRPLGAEILAGMSHQSSYLGAGTEAVDLAKAAGQAASEAGVAAIQAEAHVLEAQGYAVAGDEPACAKALDRAEHTLDRADRSCDPQWIGYLDESYLAAKFGHSFVALGRGDLARRFAEASLDMDGRRFARGRQFNLVLLAVAHVQTGEPEQASAVGLDAVEAVEQLASQRARDYLADLANRLAPHAGIGAVDEFSERVRPLLQQV